MSLSNPCTWFITGSKEEVFTYEGGHILYHFDCSGREPNEIRSGITGNWIPINVIFFANDVEHAKDVLKRMFEFNIRCKTKYVKFNNANPDRPHADSFITNAVGEKTVAEECLEKIDQWVITPAPTNQLFKVGWAHNDTIL